MAPASTTTVCDAFDYKMNVLTYPDSHEIRFNKFCDLCDKKTDAAITPEQRADARRRGAAANQVIGTLSGLGGLGAIFGAAIDQGKQAVAEEEREKERERHQDEFQRIGWHDMPEFIYRAFRDPGPGQKPVIQNIAVQGTIAGIKQPLPGAHELWTDVYFKESPDKHFDMCTSSPDIFRDIFGPDYATSMIGKTVEVSGELTRSSCQSGAGIRVSLGRQVHLVGAGRGMVATVEPTAIKFSEIAPPPPPQESLDPSMPNYYAPAGSFIAPYCRGIYDPALRLLTPDQIRVRNANQAAVQAEVQKCISSFDPTEVATHRKIAMRYCLGHNNYTTRGGATLAAYDDCMYQNDTLTALCTQELAYRTDLVDRSVYMQRPVPKCPAPRPNGREALVLLHGGHEDMGRPVVIPATGPGLPSPLEPGIMQRATASASAAKSPQAPAPAPVVPSAVPPPDPRVEPAARVRSAGRAPSASVPAASDLDNIIELVKGGMPEALVIRSIQRQGKTYNVTPEDLVKLRKAGVSQNIMSALLDPALSFQATPAPPPAAAPGRAAPQSPEDAQAGRQPQVADRRQRAEEYRACVQHAAKDNPQGGPEQEKAVTVCAQRLRAK